MEAKVHKACESWIYLGKNIKGKIKSLIKTGKWERKKEGKKEKNVERSRYCPMPMLYIVNLKFLNKLVTVLYGC